LLLRRNRSHPVLDEEVPPYGIPTFGDIYELNKAIETYRRWRGRGTRLPGHHWAMDAFDNEYNALGIPRWTRDAFRNFIGRGSHSGILHRDLMAYSQQLLGHSGLTVDNVFDGLRDYVYSRGLWIPR
jgi:hypothetical protein